jgi:hypothetical protein
VSLETPMACGVDIHTSCVTPVPTTGGWDYRRPRLAGETGFFVFSTRAAFCELYLLMAVLAATSAATGHPLSPPVRVICPVLLG